MLSWLNGRFDPFLFILLLTSSAAFLVLGGWLHTRFYHSGFSRAQEGAERQEGRVRKWKWEKVLSGLSLTTRELTKKEIRVFLRDTTQWSQLILLGVLVVVYVYNIQALRVAGDTELSFLLVNLIGFLNLGLAGFVVAAIAARFVFPAMSLEGRMTWLLRSSPLDPRKLFWVKYWVGTIPLLAVALPLILVTNFLLGVAPLLMVVSSLTMVAVTLAFSAMALAFGALYPNYETENPAEIPTSFGGLLFMMSAVAYLAGIIVLEGWPVYHFLRARFEGATFRSDGIIPLLLGLSGALVLTGVILVLSLRTGVARIREAEIYAGEGA
jgi:ABC-2 type transport system permease protein